MTDVQFLARLKDSGIISEGDAARLARVAETYGAMLQALWKIRPTVEVFVPHNRYPDGSIIPGPSEQLRLIDDALTAAMDEEPSLAAFV